MARYDNTRMAMFRARLLFVAGAALAIGASTVWILTAAPRLSATFDEPTYLATGLDHWRSGRVDALMRLGVMPLPVDVVTAPLYVAERVRGRAWNISADARGLVTNAADVPDALPIARAGTLILRRPRHRDAREAPADRPHDHVSHLRLHRRPSRDS